jgi:hypothetical protein
MVDKRFDKERCRPYYMYIYQEFTKNLWTHKGEIGMPFTGFRALLGSTTGLRADDKMELKRDKQGAPSLSNLHSVHCPPGRRGCA